MRLRTTGVQIPIIMLTAKDEILDRITDLNAGADDYVTKPFSIEELLARVKAHLRRTHPEKPNRARDWVLEQVWVYDFVGESNIIEVHIRALRFKLETNNPKRLIHRICGVGYALRESG